MKHVIHTPSITFSYQEGKPFNLKVSSFAKKATLTSDYAAIFEELVEQGCPAHILRVLKIMAPGNAPEAAGIYGAAL